MPALSKVLSERAVRYDILSNDKYRLACAISHYKRNPADFINDWVMTYDPRGNPKILPFTLFPRQREYVNWLNDRYCQRQDGLTEKSRDMGVTWLALSFAVWLWLFFPNVKISFASRKEDYVDKIGDPDSIFEKIRHVIRYLPPVFVPSAYAEKTHATFKRVINPSNGSVISGEAGDNIGRGGRSSIYFKDESAFFERPERIEAALSGNTDCVIDISTANGTNNPFYKKRAAGVIPVFTFHWRDDPRKGDDWYQAMLAKLPAHIVAQEIDIDYLSALSGALIKPQWVDAAIDADKKLPADDFSGEIVCGYDVADGGADKNAYVIRHGLLVSEVHHWANAKDAIDNAGFVAECASKAGVTRIVYDSVGVGAATKTAFKRRDDLQNVTIVAFNGGAEVLAPDSYYATGKRNREMFANIKAQSWWRLRDLLENTHKAVNGREYDPNKLISINSTIPLLNELRNELCQVTYGNTVSGKIVIDKQPEGAASPNLADALVMAFNPKMKFRVMAV